MKINVVSFNILGCDVKDGLSVSERAPRLRQVLSDFDIDLMGFQEFTPVWVDFVNENLAEEYEFFNKYRAEGSLESGPILWKKSRFDCIKKGYFWLSDTPELESKGWDEVYDCYRICCYAHLRDKETQKEFLYMNTHFGFGDNGQVASANLIYDYARRIADCPIILTGDFNCHAGSKGYEALTSHFKDVNAATVNDTRNTYNAFDYELKKGGRIDFCFITDDIKPITQELMDKMPEGKFASDHFGIISYLEL